MKKIKLGIIISIGILLSAGVVTIACTEYHLLDIFKTSVFLDFGLSAEEIQKIHFVGVPPKMEKADREPGIYLDIQKKRTIVEYLESIPLVEVDRSEFPNMSPACAIYFYDNESNLVKKIYIFGPSFISEELSGKFYRIKYERTDIIKDLEHLDL